MKPWKTTTTHPTTINPEKLKTEYPQPELNSPRAGSDRFAGEPSQTREYSGLTRDSCDSALSNAATLKLGMIPQGIRNKQAYI